MSAERRRVLRLTHPNFLALILFLSLFSFVADLSATADTAESALQTAL
jgi:hypothetical protein